MPKASAAKVRRTIVQPRLMALAEVAAYLGLSRSALANLMPQLHKAGLPAALGILGLWDRAAIDAWLDHASGLTPSAFRPQPPADYLVGSPRAPIKRRRYLPNSPESGKANYTVTEAADDYMSWFRAHRRTVKATKYCISAYILPAFGPRPAASLTAAELSNWHQALAETPRRMRVGYGQPVRHYPRPTIEDERRRRQSTANRTLSVLKAILNKAFRNGLIPTDNGWRGVTGFRATVISKADFLTAEECRALIPHLAPDFRNFVRGALFTGARFSELAGLTAGDLNLEAGTLYLAPSKTARSRHVILTEEGKAFFASIATNLNATDLVFRRVDGARWHLTDPYPRLHAACQLAGIKRISFHTLRHTYASLLAMQGTPIAVIAKNLGHTNTLSCERYYAHLSDSYVSDTIREKMPKLNISAEGIDRTTDTPQTDRNIEQPLSINET